MTRNRLPSIQLLRGVAVLAVVAYHAVETIGNRPALVDGAVAEGVANVAFLGAAGVDLFFVISGFVMAHVAGGYSDGKGGVARFLVNRMIRVLPMFWLMSAVYIAWMLCTGAVFSGAAYLNTVTVVPVAGTGMLPALYVGWTLGFELLFYLVAAGVMATGGARPARLLAIVMAAAAALGLVPWLQAILPLLLNPIVGEFALGAAAWLVWKRGSRIPPRALILLGILLMVQTLIDPWTPGFSVHPALVESGATSLHRLAFWGVPCALIVLGSVLAVPPSGRPAGGFGRLGLGRLGDASYSIYLSHPLAFEIVAYMAQGWRLGPMTLALVLLGVALPFGSAVHALVERPLLRIARRGRSTQERIQAPALQA